MSSDPKKKRKEELRISIDKLKNLLLVARNHQEKLALTNTISGLEKKLELLQKQ
jgi:hypothetical protein